MAAVKSSKRKEKPPRPLRLFWSHYRSRAIFSVIGAQIVVILVTVLSLVVTNSLPTETTALIIIFFALFFSAVGLNILLFSQLAIPLKNISMAIAKAAGERTAEAPEIPNSPNNITSGAAPLIQYLYEQSARLSDIEESSVTDRNGSLLLHAALDKSPVGIVIFDSDKNITFSNIQAPVRIEPGGKKILELLYDDEDTVEAWMSSSSKKSVHAEHYWKRIANRPNGSEDRRIFDIFGTFHKGKDAETVLAFIDKTAEYGPEDEALDFIAFAAHELRGPVTVIRGYLDVLDDELGHKLESDQKLLLNRLSVSASQLSSYIKNILNTSRYDRRLLNLTLKEGSFAGAYSLIDTDMKLRAASQNRVLNINLPTTLPTVAIDKPSIAEVMQNLIDNALKYSYENTHVNVTGHVVSDTQVAISVSDEGIGMPANVMKNLFSKFYRSHRSRDMVAGTGIGLYVSKAIIESHGGQISVKSSEGKGSVFTVTLPTYESVAEKLASAHNSNKALISKRDDRFIDNHSMYKG